MDEARITGSALQDEALRGEVMKTPDDVAAMVRLKACGRGIKRIARELGCLLIGLEEFRIIPASRCENMIAVVHPSGAPTKYGAIILSQHLICDQRDQMEFALNRSNFVKRHPK